MLDKVNNFFDADRASTWSRFTFIYSIFNTILGYCVGLGDIRFILSTLFLLSSISVIIYLLWKSRNKMHTLQILSKHNRTNTLRLLLTYEQLRKMPAHSGDRFKTSRLRIEVAQFSYKILHNPEDAPLLKRRCYNLLCSYEFTIKRCYKSHKDFDMLILQPRGDSMNGINYRFQHDDLSWSDWQTSSVNGIFFSPKETDQINGIWRARIPLPPSIVAFQITFELKNVYHNDNEGAIVICPFNFAKEIKALNIQIDYSDLKNSIRPDSNRPNSIALDIYPYDGSKCVSEKVIDFKHSDDIWQCHLQHSHIYAVYVAKIHYPE